MQSTVIDPLNPVAMPAKRNGGAVMSPGTYLRKRREASGLDLPALATRIVTLPWALREASQRDIDLMVARLVLVENDRGELARGQLLLLREAVRLDPAIYEALVLVRQAGPGTDLPIPSICKSCACTWFVACVDENGRACNWTDADEDLCSACLPNDQKDPDWPDAPQPEGELA